VIADTLRALRAKQGGVKFLGSYPAGGAEGHHERAAADARWVEASEWLDGLRAQIDG
jgi:hypothetical protein